MKKTYFPPEFDYVTINLTNAVCVSTETPMPDIIEYDDSDDP